MKIICVRQAALGRRGPPANSVQLRAAEMRNLAIVAQGTDQPPYYDSCLSGIEAPQASVVIAEALIASSG